MRGRFGSLTTGIKGVSVVECGQSRIVIYWHDVARDPQGSFFMTEMWYNVSVLKGDATRRRYIERFINLLTVPSAISLGAESRFFIWIQNGKVCINK